MPNSCIVYDRVYQDSCLQSFEAHKKVSSNDSIRECWHKIWTCSDKVKAPGEAGEADFMNLPQV